MTGNQCPPSGNTSRNSARGSAEDVASCQESMNDSRVHEAFPCGVRERPPQSSGEGSLETAMSMSESAKSMNSRSQDPRTGAPEGSPHILGPRCPGGPPSEPWGPSLGALAWGPSLGALGALPGGPGAHFWGPGGPPEGPPAGRLRPGPGNVEKVGPCGTFWGLQKVSPGRNHLAFRILRQLTH